MVDVKTVCNQMTWFKDFIDYFPVQCANNFALVKPMVVDDNHWLIFPVDDPVDQGTKIDGMVFGMSGPSLSRLGLKEFDGMIYPKDKVELDRVAMRIAYRVCSGGNISFSKNGDVLFTSEKPDATANGFGVIRTLDMNPSSTLVDIKRIFGFTGRQIKSMGSMVEAVYKHVLYMPPEERATLVDALEIYHARNLNFQGGDSKKPGPYKGKVITRRDHDQMPVVTFVSKPCRVSLKSYTFYDVLALIRDTNSHASRTRFHVMWYYKCHFQALTKFVVETVRNVCRFSDGFGLDVEGFGHVASLVASYPAKASNCFIRSSATCGHGPNVVVVDEFSDDFSAGLMKNITINAQPTHGAKKTAKERALDALAIIQGLMSRELKKRSRVFFRVAIDFGEMVSTKDFAESGLHIIPDVDPLSGFFWLTNHSKHSHVVGHKEFLDLLALFVSWRYSVEQFNFDFGPIYAGLSKPLTDVCFKYRNVVQKKEGLFGSVEYNGDGVEVALPDRKTNESAVKDMFGPRLSPADVEVSKGSKAKTKKKPIPVKTNTSSSLFHGVGKISYPTDVIVGVHPPEKEKIKIPEIVFPGPGLPNTDVAVAELDKVSSDELSGDGTSSEDTGCPEDKSEENSHEELSTFDLMNIKSALHEITGKDEDATI
jgi:hypothetical protein